MRGGRVLAAVLALVAEALPAASGLQLLPPVGPAAASSPAGAFSLRSSPKTIYIDSAFASTRDSGGLTLIPPSAFEFAQTFQQDIAQLTGANWTLERVDGVPGNGSGSGIFLGAFTGDASELAYEDGAATEEGYELVVSSTNVFIGGTGARGMWWGTRTLLQQMLLSNGTLSSTHITDAPAYATRGFMLDAGRKWYAPEFLQELCTYASFFKMSEFHYHLSDNYPLNRGHNETWSDVYSHFSLMPDDAELRGIIERPNETLSRAEFESFQQHCAARGVTVMPEIEAPGHCLYLTKWKPELALDKKDLLNLSHPEAVPTVKKIWAEFLPWFQTREVHIGADEYDETLADDYIAFVNEMARFVNATAGKSIRIWGTHEPSDNLSVSTDITVQHWQYGQSDPVALQAAGYSVVNSQDWWAYMSLKNDHTPILPAPYPQFFNEARVLNFADEHGWQWDPALFNPVNVTEQLAAGAPGNKGAILAAWNDNGPDATTQLEAYYAMRRGIPLVAARAWSGARGATLEAATFDSTVDFFSPRAPGQNLDRVLSPTASSSSPGTLFSWTRPANASETAVVLGRGSKGMNYTLTLDATGPFTLSGPDTTLALAASGALTFTTADGWAYPLRAVAAADALDLDPGQPGRIWANVSSSSHAAVAITALPATLTVATDVLGGSRVWVDGVFAGRFEVLVFGGKNAVTSWSQMALVAPLGGVSGGLQRVKVEEGVVPPAAGAANGTGGGGGNGGAYAGVGSGPRTPGMGFLVAACLAAAGVAGL